MGYRNMTLDSLIQIITEATNSGNPRKFCLFLGFGATKSSGIRTGLELMEEWDKDIRQWGAEDYKAWCDAMGITPDNRDSFYSVYYDKRYGLDPNNAD